MEKKLSSIEHEISQLEQQLDFLEKVDTLQIDIENFSNELSAGISFSIEKTIQEINFTSVVSNLELSYLSKQIHVTKSLREKQYLIKLVHLNIFEFSFAYSKKVQLLKAIIPGTEAYSIAFKQISKYLTQLKRRHSFDENIEYIRNNMAAHNWLTLNEYFQQTKLLKEEECLSMIFDFKRFHSLLFMFIALLQECHYKGIPEDFDVEAAFKILENWQ